MISDEDILRAVKKDSRVTDRLEAEVLKKRIAELEKALATSFEFLPRDNNRLAQMFYANHKHLLVKERG